MIYAPDSVIGRVDITHKQNSFKQPNWKWMIQKWNRGIEKRKNSFLIIRVEVKTR